MMTVRELRDITGLSQQKFADKYHLNVYTLREWVGKRQRTPECVLYILERIIKEVDYKHSEV